jgi:hypothetical protein
MNTDTHPREAAYEATREAPHNAPYAGLLAGTPVRDVDLEIRGARVCLRAYGDAAAPIRMVFLHGLRGDHHGLEPIVAHLVQRRPDVQVFVPDLPGFGASAPLPDGLHDVAGYAAWTSELLAAVVPEGDAVLAGHSSGRSSRPPRWPLPQLRTRRPCVASSWSTRWRRRRSPSPGGC